MPKLKICTCRLQCEEIGLADGSTVFVCVACDAYAETPEGRLVAMADKRLPRRKQRAPLARLQGRSA